MTQDDKIRRLTERLKKAERPFAVATVVRSVDTTSAKPGAKAVVDAEGAISGWVGGGCAQPAVRQAAKLALGDGRARLIRVLPDGSEAGGEGIDEYTAHCHSGGTLDIFIEPMLPPPSLIVIGASPAGQALAGLAKPLGYSVTAAVQPADKRLFAGAQRIIDGFDFGEAAAEIDAYIVVATQGRKDVAGLEAALATGAPYIAFIASRRKAGKLKEELAERGHDPAQLARIRAPAGLDIGAVSPEEIALSILAEIVRERRAGLAEVRKTVLREAAPGEGVVSSDIVSPAAAGCRGSEGDLN